MLRHYVAHEHNIVTDSSFSLGISVPSMAVTERMTRGSSVPASYAEDDLAEGRAALLSGWSSGSEPGLVITRASGALVWDSKGNESIDCTSMAWSNNIGASVPEVVEAAFAQARQLSHLRSNFDSIPLRSGRSAEDEVDYCIGELRDAISRRATGLPPAFLLEPVQGNGTQLDFPQRYYHEVRQICTEHDILLVFERWRCTGGRWISASSSVPPNTPASAMS
jgi:4-aminobutyrate aminotransferase-like enzyme